MWRSSVVVLKAVGIFDQRAFGRSHDYDQLMFQRSARLYDALYSWKDYEGEAARLHGLIQERSPGAGTLLDVACGTGQHLKHLRRHYEVEGIDLEPDLVVLAREHLPEVAIHETDMRDFDLGKRFDVVTCLFSSIGYATSIEDLEGTMRSLASHAQEGGLVIVEPWFTPDQFEAGKPWALFVDEPELKIARLDVPQVDGRVSVINFHYLVGTPAGVEHFTEAHRLRLFIHEEYLEAFERAGLDVSHDPDGLMGRGLYIGRAQN